MTLCRKWSIVHTTENTRTAITLHCRSWRCPTCNPRRKKELIAKLFDGQPDMFITLTVRAADSKTPDEHREELAWAWKCAVKAIKRRYELKHLPYAVVCEKTINGFPHFHIILRARWIDQNWLSETMDRLIGAPVVSVMRLDTPGRIKGYIAKYVGKAASQFNTFKRYFFSRDYALTWKRRRDEDDRTKGTWKVSKLDIRALFEFWDEPGWWCDYDGYRLCFTRRC